MCTYIYRSDDNVQLVELVDDSSGVGKVGSIVGNVVDDGAVDARKIHHEKTLHQQEPIAGTKALPKPGRDVKAKRSRISVNTDDVIVVMIVMM